MSLKITILGCGNSSGVPAIGNYWGDCDPEEPKNRRLRSSILVQSGNTAIIVDTGPDFREQLNRNNTNSLDAVLFSHAHGDHVHGIDDLRIITYKNKKLTPVYGHQETLDELKSRFHYLFEGGKDKIYPPVLESRKFKPSDFGKEQIIDDITFVPFEQDHGTCISVGYRFGNIAYSPDMWNLDQAAIKALQGIQTWIVDCAAYKDTENRVHANLETIYALNEQIQAPQVYLTSLSLKMDYQTLIHELPEGYEPAFDGLIII